MANHSLSRRDALRTLAIGGVASAVVSRSPALAPAAEIKIGEVPTKVLAAAKGLMEGVDWKIAHKLSAKGGDLYDLEGMADSREVGAEVTAEGKVTGFARQIPEANVPQAVLRHGSGERGADHG